MSKNLERNIRLYAYYAFLAKRAYFPLITIYLLEVANLTIAQIGIIVSLAAATSLICEIPTGHYSDRHKRTTALKIGAFLWCLTPVTFILFPTLWGAVVATLLGKIGYAFTSGAGEALIHDTLEQLGQTKNYTKVMGRAHSYGLIGGVLLSVLIPLTYSIDTKIPFALGLVTSLVLLSVVYKFKEPAKAVASQVNIISGLRSVVNLKTVGLFIIIGILYACNVAGASYNNIIIKDLGLNPSLLGWLFASANIAGAVGGRYLHHLKRFSLKSYLALDFCVALSLFLAVGLTRNLIIVSLVFIANLAFWRLRTILYQDHLLSSGSSKHRKATLVSTINFFGYLNEIWLAAIIAFSISSFGFYSGYLYFGLFLTVLVAVLVLVSIRSISNFNFIKKRLPHEQIVDLE